MKKIIAILTTCLMIISLCACSDESESSTPAVAPEVMEDIIEQNPLFVSVGHEITINDKTYTAAKLYQHYAGDPQISDEGAFVVNRVNGSVYVYASQRTSHGFKVTSWLNTGLVYEGTVNVAGIEIQIPEAVNE